MFQWIDLYTCNFAYIGSRATGNGVGHCLPAGPRWNGPTPPGIDKVFKSQADLILRKRSELVAGAVERLHADHAQLRTERHGAGWNVAMGEAEDSRAC